MTTPLLNKLVEPPIKDIKQLLTSNRMVSPDLPESNALL